MEIRGNTTSGRVADQSYLFFESAALSKLFCLFNSSSRALVAWFSFSVGRAMDSGGVTPRCPGGAFDMAGDENSELKKGRKENRVVDLSKGTRVS